MARSKSFDVDEVLDRAVEVFWTKGMAGTSIEDLVTDLGINRGSLYATFNSKEELYHRALARYHEGSMAWMRELLTADDRPLRGRIEDLLRMAASQQDNRGCFMMNTATERNSVDDACRAVTNGAIDQMIDLLRVLFEQASLTAGPGNDLLPGVTPAEAATVVMTGMQGLRTLATMTDAATRPSSERTIAVLLNGLFGPTMS